MTLVHFVRFYSWMCEKRWRMIFIPVLAVWAVGGILIAKIMQSK